MKRKKGDISDNSLIVFLVLATFISLISVWTVILALDFDVLSGQQTTQTIIIKETNTGPTTGLIGLSILPNPENQRSSSNETDK